MSDGVLDLDDPRCTDSSVAGAKAAWLARARRAGLPALPGIVIPAAVSREAMEIGRSVLTHRGPGGARLAMAQHPLPYAIADEIPGRVAALGVPVIVRSSSLLEDNGEWAGAFESLIAHHVDSVVPAVTSCYASAFATSTLERAVAADIPPGSVPMAILIQPLAEPIIGGVAYLVDGTVDIVTGAGASMGMLAGADTNTVEIPIAVADELDRILRLAHDELGITACEWAQVQGRLVLLQVKRAVRRTPRPEGNIPRVDHPEATRVAAVLRRAPGPLGRHFVLPWALGADPEAIGDLLEVKPSNLGPIKALDRADEIARTLVAEVWDRARPMAWDDALRTLATLGTPDPGAAFDEIARLRQPDPGRVQEIRPLMARVLNALAGLRPGAPTSESWFLQIRDAVDLLMGEPPAPWTAEPDQMHLFQTAVVVRHGVATTGVAAAPGRRAGRSCLVEDAAQPIGYRPRDVVIAPTADRDLAPLLWTASGLVTGKGTPAAHLFEVARARGIPAVCGVDLDFFADLPAELCVDGYAGTVHVVPW